MQAVHDYLAKHNDRFVQELCDYVKFPSVSAQDKHKPDLLAAAEWLMAKCRRIGLEPELVPTPGHPVVTARTPKWNAAKPTFLVYGHYDVQPPEPLELWHGKPFEPRIVGTSLFARGASDNKGQHLAHLNAVEAFLQTGTELPCNLVFVVEGEEEVGSNHLADFLTARKQQLKCDGVVISDTGMPGPKQPALTCSLRGIAALEVKLTGPNRDLHSGLFGGSLDNPAMALCQMLASLRDKKGRVTVPGFYDGIRPLSKAERKEMARVPFSAPAYKKFLGVRELFGEAGFTPDEQRSVRPTLEINGLTSGYQGQGSKTIVPSWASAKITCRLVPGQSPEKLRACVVKHLKKICPKTVRLEVSAGHGGNPYYVSPEGPQARAALAALRQAFGREPLTLREGGSIPIVNDFKRILGVDTLLLGLALPDDNAHSPNEKFDLGIYAKGMSMSAYLWPLLSAA